MKLFHRIENKICVLSIVGNIALTETQELESYIKPLIGNHSISSILINCQNVEIIDSRGVGLLAAIFKDLEDVKKNLMLCELNSSALGVLKSLQLHKLISIKDSELEALSELSN